MKWDERKQSYFHDRIITPKTKAETSLNVHLALNDVQVQLKSDFVF